MSTGKLGQWLANVGSGYADIAVGGMVILLLTPLVIRTLGVEAYAAWILCHTIIFYLGFLDIGFGHAQVRFHARWSSPRSEPALRNLLSTSAAGLLSAGCIAMLVGLLMAVVVPASWFDASPSLGGELRTALVLLSVDLLLSFPAAVLGNLYSGAQRFDLANARSIVLRLCTAAAQLYSLLHGGGIIALAAIQLGMTALRIAADLAILDRLLPHLLRVPVRFERRTWRGVKGYALWSAFEDLLVDGSTQLEQLLIAILLPLALLTPYSLFTTIAGVLLLAVGPLSETFLPMTAQWQAARDTPQLARLFRGGSKLALAIAVPAAVFLWYFGDAAVAYWSPEGAAGAPAGMLQLIILNFLTSAFLTTSAMMLLAAGRVRTIALLTALEIVLGVIVIVALVPAYGLKGVAGGLLIANLTLGFAVQVPIAAAAFGVGVASFLWTSLVRVLLAALPSCVVAILIKDRIHVNDPLDFALAALAIGVCYLAGLALFGTTARERADYKLLWRELHQ